MGQNRLTCSTVVCLLSPAADMPPLWTWGEMGQLLLFSAALEGAENDVAFKFELPAQVPMSREFEGSLSAHGGRP